MENTPSKDHAEQPESTVAGNEATSVENPTNEGESVPIEAESKVADSVEENDNENDEDEGESGDDEENDDDFATAEQDLFTAGDLMKGGDVAEAILFYERALVKKVSECGEVAPECGLYYFKYGDALLTKIENESDALGMPVGESPQNNAESGAEAADGAEDKDSETDAENDFTVAWENLEVARSIYEKDPKFDLDLFETILRLGDLSKEQGNPKQAMSDYEEALKLGGRLVGAHPKIKRSIAHIHFSMGILFDFYEEQFGPKAKEFTAKHYTETVALFDEIIRSKIVEADPEGFSALGIEWSRIKVSTDIPPTYVAFEQELCNTHPEIRNLIETRNDIRLKLDELNEGDVAKALLSQLTSKESTGFSAPQLQKQETAANSSGSASSSAGGSASSAQVTPQMITPKRKAPSSSSAEDESKAKVKPNADGSK